MRLHIFSVAGVLWSLALAAPPAAAQYQRNIEDITYRPGSRGPSQYLGGRHTADPRAQPLQSPRRDVALLGNRSFQFGNTRRNYRSARALSTAQVGMYGYRERSASAGAIGMGFNPEIAALSGLTAVVSPGVPLPYVGIGYIPGLDAYQYTPRAAETTRFHELFGLAPTPPPAEGEPVPLISVQLEEETAKRTARAEQEGIQYFKEATVEIRSIDPTTRVERYQECADCEYKLIQAIASLRLASDLNGKDFLSNVLLTHAYLEQHRPRMALDALLEAVRRRPDFLVLETGAAQPFANYFGDARQGRSMFLDAQLRRYSRLSELSPDNAESLALEAYCTWRLGEHVRTHEAAQILEALALRDPVEAGYLLNFALVLREATAR
jgi:hypothetical protein